MLRVRSRSRYLLPALLLAAAAWGCDSGAGASTTANPSAGDPVAPSAAPPPVNVAVMRIGTSELAEQVELSGRLEPWVEVRVGSELGGLVEGVTFEKGARVEEGQELVRVGTDLHQAALDEAEAVLTGAQATYDRVRQLVDRQAVPRQNAITATAEYDTARARVAQQRLRLERSIVRAPVSGVAVSREVEPGEVLAPGTTVTTIHQLHRLKANVPLPENDVALFRTGGGATLRVDAWPNRTFEGRIHYVAPSATGSTRTFPAEVAVDNRDGALRPGMIARVTLVRRSYASAVVVPRDVLQERDTGPVAVVLEDDTARVRPVTLGAMQGDRVLVESGLEAGDWLIVNGHRGLVDGQRVQVVERRE